MAIDQTIKTQIDNDITQNMSVGDYRTNISAIMRRIFNIFTSQPTNAINVVDTSSYLIYRVSTLLVRSSNFAQQQQYGNATTDVLTILYNNRGLISQITYGSNSHTHREYLMRMLINYYNLHYTFLSNGVLAPGGNPSSLTVPRSTIEDALRNFTTSSTVTLRQLPSPVAGNQHIRLARNTVNQGYVIEIGGSFSRTGNAMRVNVATWNLQGQSPQESKWRVAVYQLAQRNDFVLIQEAGSSLPASFAFQRNIPVRDQFGINRDVGLYRWNVGSASRPIEFDVYFYDVGRARVNLAIVTPHYEPPLPIPRPPLLVREPVIISDLSNAGSADYRPLFGLRVEGRDPDDHMQDVVIYNFHAISGGGPNAPRMVREAVWHTDVPHIIGGDFNRDPRPNGGGTNPGPWVSPREYAQIAEAAGPTHPATEPRAMLDYFVTNGTMVPPPPGQLEDTSSSDHLAVLFNFDLPS